MILNDANMKNYRILYGKYTLIWATNDLSEAFVFFTVSIIFNWFMLSAENN